MHNLVSTKKKNGKSVPLRRKIISTRHTGIGCAFFQKSHISVSTALSLLEHCPNFGTGALQVTPTMAGHGPTEQARGNACYHHI